ncbi:MAG TPA: septum formation initiator family protein [Alphaproteobacteria bacterium]|nr:septum formation initiator family protein [Alphaproteobacteria bacterium]
MSTYDLPRFELRKNIPLMIGLFLCLYFAYHTILGHRSVPALLSVNATIAEKAAELSELKAERAGLERKVTMLRPGSINTDFLEERVRTVLGYRFADEWIVIGPR